MRYALLLAPCVIALAAPFYNALEPRLLGFPSGPIGRGARARPTSDRAVAIVARATTRLIERGIDLGIAQIPRGHAADADRDRARPASDDVEVTPADWIERNGSALPAR
jgi:hypothetical protein